MAKETVMDLANAALRCKAQALPHNLDDMTEAIVIETPPTLLLTVAGLTRDPYLRRVNAKTAAYVEFFVNDFLGLAQGTSHRRHQV